MGAAAGRPGAPARAGCATRLENAIDRRSVRFGAWALRRTKGRLVRLWRRRALVLTTRARRSGLPRTVVVQYFPDGENLMVVAANIGMPRRPAWFLNLSADPHARVEVDGRAFPVRAEELPAAEAAAWWPRVLAQAPDYARYPRRAGHSLPLLRPVPVTQEPPRQR